MAHMDASLPKRTNWLAIAAILIAVGVPVSNALLGYGHDQRALAVKDAQAATYSDLQRLDREDAMLRERVGALEALRKEDSDRLRRIEDLLLQYVKQTKHGT